MNEELELQLCSTQTEMIVLGTFFKDSLVSFSYTSVIKNDDFFDKGCAFFYQFFQDYILNCSDTFTAAKANMFAASSEVRLQGYKKFGGFKFIEGVMSVAVEQYELGKFVDKLKKYSLLRSLNKTYDVTKVLSHPKFEQLTADDCANIVRGGLDTICSRVITGLDEPIDAVANASSIMDEYFKTPAQGYNCAWDFITKYCSGILPGDTYGIGALSNSGKGRSLIYLCTHLALVENVKCAFFANEMQTDKMLRCIHVSVLNSPAIQKLFGHEISITEERFKHGLYLNSNKEIIYRNSEKETVEQFIKRLQNESEEYRNVKDAMKWLEERKDMILFKNVAANYSDENITRLVRQTVRVNKTQCWFYDTLKHSSNSDMSSWSDFVKTTTLLTELNVSLNVAAIMSFQMADAANALKIEDVNSTSVATAKHIFHLFSNMVMMLHLKSNQYDDYEIVNTDKPLVGWTDEVASTPLDKKKKYVLCNLIKNRNGGKDMFALEADLDRNVWQQVPGTLRAVNKHKRNQQD